jgi:hypothetical protein
MLAEVLLNGDVLESSAADNATATIAKAATAATRHFIGGIEAHYSAAVSALKNITVTRVVGGATVTKTYRWDFARGPFVHNFPLLVHGDYNTQVSVALEASGTGGITGVAAMWVASA